MSAYRALDLIEESPARAHEQNSGADYSLTLLASAAISLKRIADALTGTGQNAFTRPLNQYGENIAECIEGQFNRSQNG